MEHPQEKPPTEALNRSSSASTSSAISTTLAVASAVQNSSNNENSHSGTQHFNQARRTPITTTVSTASKVGDGAMTVQSNGLKRKADEPAINKRLKSDPVRQNPATGTRQPTKAASSIAPASSTRPNITAQRPLQTRRAVRPPAASPAPRAPTPRAPAPRAPIRKAVPPRPTTTPPSKVTNTTTAARRPTAPATAQPRATIARGRTTTVSKTQQPRSSISTTSSTRSTQQPRSSPTVSTASQASSHNSTVEPSCEPMFLAIAKTAGTLTRAKGEKRGQREDAEDLCQILTGFEQHLHGLIEAKRNETFKLESANKSIDDKILDQDDEEKACLERIQALELEIQDSARRSEEEIKTRKLQHLQAMEQSKAKESQLKQEIESTESTLSKTSKLLEDQLQENLSLRATVSAQTANQLLLEGENSALKQKDEQTESTLADRDQRIKHLKGTIADLKTLIIGLEERIRTEETIRRRLHNTIQELKGNIRVFCRVRPVTSNEGAPKAETTAAAITFPDPEGGKQIEFAHSKESARGAQIAKSYPFTFDRVFQPSSTQQDVFDEISQLVQSALDGYNVCIFAYGQTGSGKTHTMEGPLNATQESMGMIPRSVLQIYETAKQLESKGWKYTMEGQYVEIYNESINDLLGNYAVDQNKKHEIRHAPGGKTTITDITTVVLTSPEKVAALLRKAAHNRSVGSTQMNERSSRSHCVFTLRLTGTNSVTEETSEGVLNLIDLAGSERLSQSGATGDRLRETQAINKSLSCLGDVIYAIANKDAHIPYRNSKLTYLLQNSLGGNSKTLMFVNISPLMSNFGESLCSLRFATKVNSCTIGTATTKRAVKLM
ncbi:kinesin-like nuclear fusion protein [Podila horticola]|nr:kinesin-like nuclear fusion protein [Podila horticola]